MWRNFVLALGASAVLCTQGACQTPYYHDRAYQDRGTLLGGLAGAGIGAAVGNNNNNTLAGTLIGAAAGAMAGGAVGSSMDHEAARTRAIVQQRVGHQLAGAVTHHDAIAMSQAGLSEEVIITYIRSNGVARRPQVQELVEMQRYGVSERVINAMQTAQPPAAYAPAPRPVVVQEHHYIAPPPPWWYGRPRHVYHHYPPPRPGVGFSVHVRN